MSLHRNILISAQEWNVWLHFDIFFLKKNNLCYFGKKGGRKTRGLCVLITQIPAQGCSVKQWSQSLRYGTNPGAQ